MSNRSIIKLFFVGLLFISSGFFFGKTPPPLSSMPPIVPSPTVASQSAVLGDVSKTRAQVLRVIDGDTIQVIINATKETVRLIGVDTPEPVDPRKPVQCFGKEASDFAKSLLTDKTIFLEADTTQGDRDKYQRLLRFVFLENGTNVNKLLISEGYAHEYTYHLPYKYQGEFKAAEIDAQENNRGLWRMCYTK